MSDGAGDFRMMNRLMVDSILKMKEYNRYMKGIFSFVGFETKWLPFRNVERAAGQTKWTLKSLFRYAIDGIFSFSTAPITLASIVGVLLVLAALVISIYGLVQIGLDAPVSGWLWMTDLILFLGGIQMSFIGIIGQYIAKDYMENKNRPIYIIKESNRFRRN